MLIPEDRRYLQRSVGRQGAAAQAVLVLVAVGCLGVAGFHVWLAGRWADIGGASLAPAAHDWINGFDPDRLLSPAYFRAVEDLSNAAFEAGLAVVLAVGACLYRSVRARHQRLIAALKAGGTW